MSRSYKKGYGSFACYTSDKPCRKIYSRSKRRKDKLACNTDIENAEFDTEKISNKKIDYSATYSSKWDWASDGGVYFQNDLSTLRQEFDTEVFGYEIPRFYSSRKYSNTIWEKYNETKNDYLNGKFHKSNWCLMDMLFSNHFIPLDFSNEEELVSWLKENEEKIILLWYKRKYHK